MAKMGRPKLLDNDEKTKKQFELLMGIPFVTSKIISDFFGVENSTLIRWIKENYDVTFADLKAQKQEGLKLKLAGKQFEVAMTGNVTMLVWLGKQYLGQKDNHDVDLSGKEIKITITKDDEKL
jgi:hypothetical protein